MRWNSCARGLVAAAILLFAGIGANPAGANEIVLLGDSWGVGIGPSVRSTLDAEGFASIDLDNASVGGSTSAEWAAGDYGPLTDTIGADTELVHIIIGGNDLIAGASGDPLAVIAATIASTISVLGDIAAVTSAPILFTGYDYLPSPTPPLTSAEANAFLDAYVDGVASAVLGDASLSGQVTVLNTHGLMQVAFGVPQLGILPGDPSLPDATLPGPTTAFSDPIHLTSAGYDVLAQELFDQFYEPVLVPEPASGALLLLGLLVLAQRRRDA